MKAKQGRRKTKHFSKGGGRIKTVLQRQTLKFWSRRLNWQQKRIKQKWTLSRGLFSGVSRSFQIVLLRYST